MAVPDNTPQPHPRFHYSSGDITIQVKDTVFKIHQLFLVQHSSIWRDMLSVPRGDNNDGTDQKPLVLPEDDAEGWELLLNSFYRTHPTKSMEFDGNEQLALLRIAHKYCMDVIEEDVLVAMKNAKTTSELVLLMAASKIIGSDTAYKQALDGLIVNKPNLTSEEARLIGVDALYDIFTAIPAAPANPLKPSACSNAVCNSTHIYCYDCSAEYRR